MINLQLYIEIMRLGAEEGRGKSRMISSSGSSGGEKNGKPQGTPRRPPGDLSQARERGKPQWQPECLDPGEQ